MPSANWRQRVLHGLARLLRVSLNGSQQPTYAPNSPPALNSAEPTTTMVLDSVHPYLRFRAEFAIRFVNRSGDLAREQAFHIARAAIYERARTVTRRFAITQHDLVRGELTAHLAERRSTAGNVIACASCEAVSVDPDDLAIVVKYEQASRNLQALRLQDEINDHRMRQYATLLGDPVRASTWWLARNPDKILEMADVVQTFQHITGLLTPVEEPQGSGPDTPGLLAEELFRDAEPPAQLLLHQTMAKIARAHRRPDLAERHEQLATHSRAPETEVEAEG